MEKPWKVPGRCRDNCPAVARMLRRTLHPMRHGHCSEVARQLPGQFTGCYADDSADTAPDATPDAAWTAAAIANSFANHRANFGANFGANIHRSLVRRFPPTARTRLGSCPAIARMIHRMLRGRYGGHYGGRHAGCCADIARSLRALQPYILIRGWCLTKLPAFQFQKAATNHVRLNV